MVAVSLEQQIIERVKGLDEEKQKQVLEYLGTLTRPKGEPGWLFLERTRDIHISPEDLKAMEETIDVLKG